MSTQEQTNTNKPRVMILDVATRLFSENGYVGTTMREIATAVGVLPGSLYAHIDGKETLLLEIVESGIERFIEGTADLAEISDPAERARAAIRAHLAVVGESPERTLVVFHQWRYLSGANRDHIIKQRKRYEDVFVKIVKAGVKSGAFSAQLDERIAVLSMLGSLNWAAEWFRPQGPQGPEEVGERLADTILGGLEG